MSTSISISKTAGLESSVVYKFALFAFIMCAAYTIAMTNAYATNTTMGNVMCQIIGFIFGNLGRGIATIAVVAVGVGASLGKVSWGMALTVAIGITVVFNAPGIVIAIVLASGTAGNFVCGGSYGIE